MFIFHFVVGGDVFWGWVLIFWERGSGSGLCPDGRGVADWYGFFCFESFGEGVRFFGVRMGGERRFASLLRIGGPGAISATFRLLRVILKHCAILTSPYACHQL